ncbi:MAG TPA: hypothetical protein VML00_00430, partial [Bacteroidota bacterium]|nr:hypothetical protein [Bacteroidota bacterium]
MKKCIVQMVFLPLLMGGCGTTQPFVPAVPQATGKGEIRVSVGYSTGSIQPFSLQWGAWAFVGERDALGMTWAGVLIPSTVSYVHYAGEKTNLQFHYNDISGVTLNPAWEFDVGFSSGTWDRYDAGKIGVGYFDTPLLSRMLGAGMPEHAFVPIVGYQGRSAHLVFEADLLFGLSSFYVRNFRRAAAGRGGDSTGLAGRPFLPRTIPRSRVKSFEEIPAGGFATGWQITLDSANAITIASRDPYADCIACGQKQSNLAAYPASPDHRVYWVWGSRNEGPYAGDYGYPVLMEL